MAIQHNNLLLTGVSGTVGKQIVFRQRNGRTIISSYPDFSDRVLSPKQLEVNRMMAAANEYAKDILYDEKKCQAAQIRLDLPRKRLYTTLVREYFKENYKKDGEKTNPVS